MSYMLIECVEGSMSVCNIEHNLCLQSPLWSYSMSRHQYHLTSQVTVYQHVMITENAHAARVSNTFVYFQSCNMNCRDVIVLFWRPGPNL